MKRIGAVAYKLELPPEAKIHPVFHVSLLKKQIGDSDIVQLPQLDEVGEILPQPEAILDSRVRKNKKEVLVHWRGLSPLEATWERLDKISKQFPDVSLTDVQVP